MPQQQTTNYDGQSQGDDNAEQTGLIAHESTQSVSTVIPFNEEITTAKNRLHLLLERLSEDSVELRRRLDLLEPRQVEAEQALRQHLAELETLTETTRAISSTLQTVEEGQGQLKEQTAAEFKELFLALEKIDHRVVALEPTPAKVRLLDEKLSRVDEQLNKSTEELFAQTNELGRRSDRNESYISDLKRRNYKLEEFTHHLSVASKRLGQSFSFRSRLFGAGLALVLLALLTLGYLFDQEHQLNELQQLHQASNQALIQTNREALTAQNENIKSIEQSINPSFDVNSSAITIAVHDSDWVLLQKPEQMTIELYGTRNKSEAFNYIRKVQSLLVEPVSYVKTELRGRDWYVVLYGIYATEVEGRAMMSVLPSVLRQQNPTVRQFGWIQQLL
ncbi:hypothetical protein BOW53_16070 [Solemya pervernicosa gill symbiont]|uniref:SPOR domain-containing protein n=2 Tax=Gammaproteobacteria incertae sedis TaxID=118884 RepID=A0A1T2KZQ1_9GAMM|nr:hypothetical protein [Candidatus Reidiella endopervernicosa]OOZ38284.1 hypothetical protein BOW53_16070 [Solemya pervernicosa gill symbiont]QKQ26605.1 hypothetical protein HUE57_10190 [Candidatus Reidiella endopervernicosa]